MNRADLLMPLAVTLISATILGGCFGGKAAAVRSENQQRAETALSRGIRAGQKGDSREALSQLGEALTISTSIEDLPLRVSALINLARLKRLNQEQQQSEVYGDQALALLNPDSRQYSEAAHEKALLELSRGRFHQALEWAQKSINSENGDQAGSRLNLAGRINLEMGNYSAAADLARKALEQNRAAGHGEEEANSLRILGITSRLEQRYAESERRLLDALSIDKRLGRSTKIAIDLEELALNSQSRGDFRQALHFLERAVAVHEASGRVRQVLLLLEKQAELHSRLGEGGKADELRKAIITRKDQNSSATINPSSRP